MNIHLKFSKHCWQYPILVTLHKKGRNSRLEVFCKKGVFENVAKDTEKHLCQSLFFTVLGMQIY